MTGALAGTRVLEIGGFVTGPYAAMLLADLGADVIKVEPPEGDPMRSWGGAAAYSPTFLGSNRNKRSVRLDLKTAGDRKRLHALVATADVAIVNLKPSSRAALGVEAGQLTALNPRLVYCSITGFGESGPYAARPAFDTIGQAVSGLLSLLVDPAEGQPAGLAVADYLTGMTACHAVMGALLHRATSGEGQVVSTSLLEAATAFVGESAARHLNLAPGEEAGGERRDRRQALAQVYLLTSGDGLPLVIHLSSPTKFWRAMCEALGIDDLAADEALDRRSERTRNFRRIRDRVQQRVNELTRAECLELLIEAGVPAAPVNRVDDVVVDPQVAHLDMVWTLDVDDERGTTRTIRPGFSMSAGGPELRLPPPLLGEHDSALLGE